MDDDDYSFSNVHDDKFDDAVKTIDSRQDFGYDLVECPKMEVENGWGGFE